MLLPSHRLNKSAALLSLVARGSESVFRGSLFRTGYEIFYTPVRAGEKRAAKSIIDVGFDRLGDAIGGGLIRLLILLPAAQHYTAILGTAVVTAALALVVARRLNRGYIATLERSLLDRAVELDLSHIEDITTRTAAVRTLHMATTAEARKGAATAGATVTAMTGIDAEIHAAFVLIKRTEIRREGRCTRQVVAFET